METEKPKVLSIDIECFSDVDLVSCGVYRYVESKAFEILLFAYSVDEEETQLIDLKRGERLPQEIMKLLADNTVRKTAFHSNFERTCINQYFGFSLQPEAWYCTAVQASLLALPLSLEGVGEVLNLDKKKLSEGKELIRYFCCPCKPTKGNQGRTRNLPEDAPEKWELFKRYCIRDVDVEKQIRKKLEKFPISEQEQRLYCLDQRINDRGIQVDNQLVKQAMVCDRLYKEAAVKKAQELSGLDNPNSVSQLKEWLFQKGIIVDSLSKEKVQELMKHTTGEVLELLQLRRSMAKTSVKKYEAIDRVVCSDGRVRGVLQFYGANRTGRWAGRLVQIHNLVRNSIENLELARSLLTRGCYEAMELLYESTPHLLSELIRTAFIPREGYRFIISDFSAIEARVLAWMAGESWRIAVFQTHGKIYEASASAMFHVPIEEIGKTSPLRQKGKIAELALGYGGAVGALLTMGALEMGLKEEELPSLVTTWRNANPHITHFWWAVDAAAIAAVKNKEPTRVGRIGFHYQSGILFITLPSGRKLSYIKPRIGINQFGREALTYEGIGESKKWIRIKTYGPKLVENMVQAISRDILAEAMLRLEQKGFAIVCHVHDEVVLEVPIGTSSVEEVNDIMAVSPDWAEGLFLKAAGFESLFYKKD
ncbi:DNA polymerase [Anaeromicropila populeti]|uniref:DNA-directed DNA polymerase n=1 Tax=Anaeromicropila populeti TaxID=37658 RepID=A0A1I6LDS7_9FIRM|nr:DNA polymerase [Anaeromicropila populeti]SFS01587.1 DNA polymerase [Anaeromicropila populeti]